MDEYDDFAMRRLCASIVERAIEDHRTAITRNIIDENTQPTKELNSREVELVSSLHWFFRCGGVELLLESAGFKISTEAIRRKIIEPIKKQ